jgi:2-dehydro-3-deoxyphosphogluconate aldolase/(4S)-4-hydroxy-2-oxoglutarate aldolase
MIFGAGTVTSPEMAEVAAAAGAAFIISPNTDQSVIARTRELELVSVPGAMTPTEIMNADKWGADIVKLFPSGVLGLDYIKAIRAPINHVKLMATGGVNVSNIKSFLDAGMVGVGVGGNLCSKKLVAEGRFEEIAALAAEYVAAIGG